MVTQCRVSYRWGGNCDFHWDLPQKLLCKVLCSPWVQCLPGSTWGNVKQLLSIIAIFVIKTKNHQINEWETVKWYSHAW